MSLCLGFFIAIFSCSAPLVRAATHVARASTYLKRVATPSAQATARKRLPKKKSQQSSFQSRETMNLGDEHMTDETRDIYRAKVAERQAAEDALVQKRIEAASDYVGTRAEANRCVKERVATFDVHTQVGTFKAERETKLRDVTMPKNREGEHAFLEALETAAESDATWARVLSLVDTEPDSWGGADLARLRAVLIKKKAEETQALAA